jgi:uncharacterized membrane protein YfcA
MRETTITLPELALIAGTRALLGAGIGLLLGDFIPKDQRKAVGWTLLLVGAATTVPLAFEVLGGGRQRAVAAEPEQTRSKPRFEPNDLLSRAGAADHQ